MNFIATSRTGVQYPVVSKSITAHNIDDIDREVRADIVINDQSFPGRLVIHEGVPSFLLYGRDALNSLGIPATVRQAIIALDRDFRPEILAGELRHEIDKTKVDLLNLFIGRCTVLTEQQYDQLTRWRAVRPDGDDYEVAHHNRKPELFGHFDGARQAIVEYFFEFGGNSRHALIYEWFCVRQPFGNDDATYRHVAVYSDHSYWYGHSRGTIGTIYVSPSMWAGDRITINAPIELIENGAMNGDGDGDTWRERGLHLQYQFDAQRDEDLLLAILGSIQPPVDVTVNINQHVKAVNDRLYAEWMAVPALASLMPMTREEWTGSLAAYDSPLSMKIAEINRQWLTSGDEKKPALPDRPARFVWEEHEQYVLTFSVSYAIDRMTLSIRLINERNAETRHEFNFSSDGRVIEYEQGWLKNLREFRRTAEGLLRGWDRQYDLLQQAS